MKLHKLTLVVIAIASFFISSAFAADSKIKDNSLGLRKTNLLTEEKTVSDETKYRIVTGKQIGRAHV